MRHSEWATPTDEEYTELEATQLQDAAGGNGNGKNGGGTTVPINGGMWIVLLFAIIFGLCKQSRISRHSTLES